MASNISLKKLAFDNTQENVEMRTVYNDTLMDLAENNSNIVILDADLMGCVGTRVFAKKYPDRSINCGIQEANMIGVASGLSLMGKIPFAHSFGTFVTRRTYDQIFISAAYAKLNVNIIGSDPGITASLNGGTHMSFEDMGIMRCVPNATILEPTDTVMLRCLLNEMANDYGIHYMRLVRKNAMKVYREGEKFKIGKAAILKDGTDVTIIASGYCVAESIKACIALEKIEISVRLINMFTWKPIDEEAIIQAAKDTGAIVTAENHNVINGLGSAVSEVLVKNYPVPVEMIGTQDEFGEVGPIDYLAKRYHMRDKDIVEAAKKVVLRKPGDLCHAN